MNYSSQLNEFFEPFGTLTPGLLEPTHAVQRGHYNVLDQVQ